MFCFGPPNYQTGPNQYESIAEEDAVDKKSPIISAEKKADKSQPFLL